MIGEGMVEALQVPARGLLEKFLKLVEQLVVSTIDRDVHVAFLLVHRLIISS